MKEDIFDMFESERAFSEEEAKVKEISERMDLKKVLDLPEGRRVLWRIMALAKTFQPTFNPENTHLSAHDEGMRRVGIELNKWIMKVNPLMFSKMQSEMYALGKQEEKERELRKKGVKRNG